MRQRLIQIVGLAVSAVYAVVIVWVYATEPRNFKEVATGADVAAGTYLVDQEKFNAALALFRRALLSCRASTLGQLKRDSHSPQSA